MQPALTQLMKALVGVAADVQPTRTSPRTSTCGASLEPGYPIPLCRSGSPTLSLPLGDGGGSRPGGAGLLVSSQARGNRVGKDTAPCGANESREDFQEQQIPFQLSLSPRRCAGSQHLWDPAWRPPGQAAGLRGKSFQQIQGWPQGRRAGWRVSCGRPTV